MVCDKKVSLFSFTIYGVRSKHILYTTIETIPNVPISLKCVATEQLRKQFLEQFVYTE